MFSKGWWVIDHQWLTYYTSYFSLLWFLSPNFPQAFLRAAAPSNSSRSFKLLWLWPINDHPRKITSIWYPRTRSLYWQLEQSWQTVLLLTWNPSRGWALSKDQRLHMDPTTTSKLPSVIESTVFVTLTLLRSWTDAMIVVLCRSDSTWSWHFLADKNKHRRAVWWVPIVSILIETPAWQRPCRRPLPKYTLIYKWSVDRSTVTIDKNNTAYLVVLLFMEVSFSWSDNRPKFKLRPWGLLSYTFGLHHAKSKVQSISDWGVVVQF